jgi:ATP-dependent DNA helicase RecG
MTEAELRLILQEGEGYRLEFKENVGNLEREMVAFANGSGGRILLGINDLRQTSGIAITNELKSRVQDIANNCEPRVRVELEEFENVLIVHVREGTDKPYHCAGGFFLRVGPNSQKLRRNEIIEFLKAEGKVRFEDMVSNRFLFDEHFDPTKLREFLRRAGITAVLEPGATLVNLGVAERQEGKVLVNNAGVLLFARNLADIYFHTVVTCALYKGIEKVNVLDRKDFNSDIVSSVENAMVFLKQHLRLAYEFTGATRRKEVPEIPHDALREAVINAVIHRDYFERGANVMVEIFDDRVEITNPGGLPKGLKPEEFGTKSVLRNPLLADLFHRAGYIERMGTGIGRMRELMAKAGLPPMKFGFTAFFTATFLRPKPKETGQLAETFRIKFGIKFGIKGKRATRVADLLWRISSGVQVTAHEYASDAHVSARAVEKDILLLRQRGLIERQGSRKTGSYVLTDKGRALLKELGK